MTKLFIGIGVILGFIILGGLYLNTTGRDENLFSGAIRNEVQKNQGQTKLSDYGPAPDFSGIQNWLNSDPLKISDLKGKVVLVDFWTYSCINCIRTLPYLTSWYDKYKDQGLVVVGVHTPEFAFEKETKNVSEAIKRHSIRYPVAQDNDFATWRAYGNQYWPAKYLVDQTGQIVYYHFGEGKYKETENAIRSLLGLDTEQLAGDDEPQKSSAKTPEIYFGLSRLAHFANLEYPGAGARVYTLPNTLKLNEFAISGMWEFDKEKAILVKPDGKIRLHYFASEVNIVAHSKQTIKVQIFLDGKETGEIEISDSKLYNLIKLDEASEHTLDLEIPSQGFEIFTFTFS